MRSASKQTPQQRWRLTKTHNRANNVALSLPSRVACTALSLDPQQMRILLERLIGLTVAEGIEV